MSIVPYSHAEHELDQLANRFHHWRQNRTTPRARIPQPLWDHAVSLTTMLPISRVAKRLRLNGCDLKKRCTVGQARPSADVAPPPPGFVEVTAARSWFTPGMEVDLQRADGTRMRIAYHEPQPPLVAVVRTFLETP
jgi:hypothetical protein